MIADSLHNVILTTSEMGSTDRLRMQDHQDVLLSSSRILARFLILLYVSFPSCILCCLFSTSVSCHFMALVDQHPCTCFLPFIAYIVIIFIFQGFFLLCVLVKYHWSFYHAEFRDNKSIKFI